MKTIILLFKSIRLHYLLVMHKKLISLCDENLSLMDSKTLKASLYGKEYFKTFECAGIDLKIEINNVGIEIYKSILKIK